MFVTVEVNPQQATADVISPVLVVNAQVAGSFQHNALKDIQGGLSDERYHLSAAELADFGILVGGGDSTLHYHSADRARANHTGTQLLATISDAGTMAAENAADYVEVAGDEMTGALSIFGSADEVQSVVRGVAGQSEPFHEWQDSFTSVIGEMQSHGVLASYGPDNDTSNTFFGNNSGLNINVTGTGSEGLNNTGFGSSTLKANTTGANNTGIGQGALQNNTIGIDNTAFGVRALTTNTIGSFNMAFGGFALSANIDGSTNVGIGYASLLSLTTGNFNVALGADSLRLNQTGSKNVALGYRAGFNELGSETLYIANSNTTTPLIYGLFEGAGAGLTIHSQNLAGVPLTVKGIASQSSNLQEWQNSSGTILNFISSTRFNVGLSAPSFATFTRFGVKYNAAETSGIIAASGTQLVATPLASTTAAFYGNFFESGTGAGTSVTISTMVGLKSRIQHRSATTITNAYGIDIDQIYSASVAGNISNLRNLNIRTPLLNSGAITNLYGLYLQDQNNADTLNYSIYTNAGDVRFGDQVEIVGSQAGVVQSIVKGAVSQTANLQAWQNSSGTPLVSIDEDGQLVLGSSGRVTKIIDLGPADFELGAPAPTQAVIGNFSVRLFQTGTIDTLHLNRELLTDWEEGTDITVSIKWAPVDANAGTTVWQLTWSAVAEGVLISAAGTTTSIADATNSTQYERLDSGDMIIPGASIAKGDEIGLTLFRDAGHGSDTYANSAAFIKMRIEYTSNKLGDAI